MNAWIFTANVLGWPVIHLVIARTALRIPLDKFAREDHVEDRHKGRWEARFYRNWLAIQRWKSRLPDGAPWLGGFSKKRLIRRDREYFVTFIQETRRAEFAHWCMLCCLPVFFVWNPLWACGVMTGYAIGANVPCILAQRYNRLTMLRLLHNMESRTRITPGNMSGR